MKKINALLGAVTNQVSMPTDLWVITGVCVWLGSLLFSAFGLFMGYLLPSENVTQIISLVLMLCAFAGGLFIPVSHFPGTDATPREVHSVVRAQRTRSLPLGWGSVRLGVADESCCLAGSIRPRGCMAVPR